MVRQEAAGEALTMTAPWVAGVYNVSTAAGAAASKELIDRGGTSFKNQSDVDGEDYAKLNL